MKDWLSKLHEFFLDREPFVVATAYAYNGSSPETPGVALFHSCKKTHRFTSSDFRYQKMLETAANMLASPTAYSTENLALGKVAGIDNGQCEVIYEFFDAQQYPDWLKRLRTYSYEGVNCTLLREFEISTNDVVRTKVLYETEDNNIYPRPHKAGSDCWMQKNNTSLQLLRTIQTDTIVMALVGSHPVADEIQNQCTRLPIKTVRLKSVAEHSPEQSVVIVMTTDHELDYHYCEALLKKPVSKNAFFIGCIGSKKKAQIFRKRLLQNGVSESQLKHLYMPVGVTEISGKQNSVVAASIIAQIMMQHNW